MVVQPYYQVDLIRFSIVAFDREDVERSGQFTIVFYYTELSGTSDQYITIPQEFATSTLIGLLDYKAVSASYGLEFNWEFDLANNRIKFNNSVPHTSSSADGGLTSFRIAVFYMKTWFCPATHIYFNLDTNMCDDYCAMYMYANSSATECQPC